MFIAKHSLLVAVLGLAGVALLGCAQPYRQSSGLGAGLPSAQRQPARHNGYIDTKANRQVRRQQQRANSRIDWETDRAVDRGVNKVLNDIFD